MTEITDSNEKYEFVYACFHEDKEIIGFTLTAEEACQWAARVAANNKYVQIIKVFVIKNPRSRD